MKIFKINYAIVIVLLVSTTAFAASQDGTDNSQDMPMMNQDGGMMMSPEMMGQMMASGKMNSEMMEQMMASMKMNSKMMEQMMTSGKMNSKMMEQMMTSGRMKSEMMEQMMTSGKMNSEMMASGQHRNMPMKDHQGMQEMMQIRMQHMVKMEQHLEKIESLLTQLLEVQKSK